MHQRARLHRRVFHRTLVMLERSAGKLARSVLRGERSREAPDLPGASKVDMLSYQQNNPIYERRPQ